MNVLAMAVNVFFPWVIFLLVAAMLSFEMHYREPSTCQALVIVAASLLVVTGIGDALWMFWQRSVGEARMGGASWLLFLCVTSLCAVFNGVVFGNRNFWVNSEPFYDITSLNSYEGVDPSRMRGQELMDAGRVVFTKDVHLDLTKSMSFRNQETYCVAPITVNLGNISNPPLASYDFWAVGKDCCSGAAADFHCGAYSNPRAHGGVRLVRDNERAFYRLAVQQALSAHAIQAVHPLFFHWVADPAAATYTYRQEAYKAYMLAMIAYLLCQLLLVAFASWCFAKCRQIELWRENAACRL